MLSSEVEAWIAAQRPNKLAQAAVAEAMAAWAILLDRSAVTAVWTFREGKIWGNSKIFFGRNFLLVSKDRCV